MTLVSQIEGSVMNPAHVYSIKSHMQLLILYDGKNINA
jgi:hypothetical protein